MVLAGLVRILLIDRYCSGYNHSQIMRIWILSAQPTIIKKIQIFISTEKSSPQQVWIDPVGGWGGSAGVAGGEHGMHSVIREDKNKIFF